MQRHTPDLAFVNNLRLCKWAAVLNIATNRMSKFRQVDADLIGAPRFQFTFQFAVSADSSQRSKVRDGSFTCVRRCWIRCRNGQTSAQAITSIANKMRGHRLVFDRAGDQRKVFSHRFMVSKLSNDPGLRIFVTRKCE